MKKVNTNKTNTMKKIAFAVLAVLMMGTLFTGCGVEVTLSEHETKLVEDALSTVTVIPEVIAPPEATATPETTATPEIIRYFYNDTLDGRWTPDAISVVAKEVYFENGYLVAHCYIVNGYATMATNVSIPALRITGEDNLLIAEADFNAQNLTMEPLTYVEHTFTFAPDTIVNDQVEMTTLGVSCQFRATH